ncbi:tellurite resistance TerB family protein [Persicimonas caeni]|nr:TerB family tellurite resistance protein [Persicimonas caeni]
MYFSNASRATLQVHSELRQSFGSLNNEVINALLGEEVAAEYGDLVPLINLGSALMSGDSLMFALAKMKGWRVVGRGVDAVVSTFVTSAWFAIKYPLLGGVLKAIPFVSGFFGPPGWLVTGVSFAAMKGVRTVVSGVTAKRDRQREIAFLKAAIPSLYALADRDGEVSIEELRFMRDLLRRVPSKGSFDPRARLETVRESNAEELALQAIREQSLTAAHKETLLKFGVLICHSDGDFDSTEKDFFARLAKALGYSEEKYLEFVSEVERQHEREKVLAEGAIRALWTIAEADGMQEDELELLDMTLMSQVPPEAERRRIVNDIRESSGSPAWSKSRITQGQPLTKSQSLLKKLPFTKSEPDYSQDLQIIVDEAAMFVVTLERLRKQEELRKHRARLFALAESYGIERKDVQKQLEKFHKAEDKAEKKREKVEKDTSSSRCPNCSDVGKFALSQQRYLGRNEYACGSCGAKMLLCRMPKCVGMVEAGDFYDAELCEEHSLI